VRCRLWAKIQNARRIKDHRRRFRQAFLLFANPERSSKGRRREAADAATNDTARSPRTMVTTYLSLVDLRDTSFSLRISARTAKQNPSTLVLHVGLSKRREP
jgi:hypothetical protein